MDTFSLFEIIGPLILTFLLVWLGYLRPITLVIRNNNFRSYKQSSKVLFIVTALLPFLILSLWVFISGSYEEPSCYYTDAGNILSYLEKYKSIIGSASIVVFLLPIGLFIVLLIQVWRTAGIEREIATHTLVVACISILLLGAIFVGSLNTANRKSRDMRRIGDIGQIRLGLELYYDQHKQYPLTLIELEGEVACGGARCMTVPHDPCYQRKLADPAHDYEYGVSHNSDSYVLKAILRGPNNQALKNDIDGSVYGIWCGNPDYEGEYCVGNYGFQEQ